MRFLVDAQLPRRLASHFQAAGFDTLHTLDLPKQNRTTDQEILDLSRNEQRVVATKDSDFVDYFILRGQPYKLLLVSTGNISNQDLDLLFVPNIPGLAAAFETFDFIEITQSAIIVRS